jgi:D-alanyl-D-alanine carboxypeptidase
MKENRTKFYELGECKTEFLFESDAEKVALKEASKPKRPKIYKKIIINTVIICFFMTTMAIALNYYETNAISKINASLGQINSSNVPNEKLNDASDNLKTVTNNYEDKYAIIINKANPISEDLIKNYTLVTVENNMYDDIKLEEETYENYLKLKENLLERSYYINIRSGFRTFNESQVIFNNYALEKGSAYAEKYAATPGTSEHNTGLAFDFIISSDKNASKTDYESDEYFYLENIAYLYGFIIRYPKDKEAITGYNYEPWHLRYVGSELAKYLKKNNLTLEEYYES